MNAYQATAEILQNNIKNKEHHIGQYKIKIAAEKNDYQRRLYQEELSQLERELVGVNRELFAIINNTAAIL